MRLWQDVTDIIGKKNKPKEYPRSFTAKSTLRRGYWAEFTPDSIWRKKRKRPRQNLQIIQSTSLTSYTWVRRKSIGDRFHGKSQFEPKMDGQLVWKHFSEWLIRTRGSLIGHGLALHPGASAFGSFTCMAGANGCTRLQKTRKNTLGVGRNDIYIYISIQIYIYTLNEWLCRNIFVGWKRYSCRPELLLVGESQN